MRCEKGTAKCEKNEVVTQKSVNVYVYFYLKYISILIFFI